MRSRFRAVVHAIIATLTLFSLLSVTPSPALADEEIVVNGITYGGYIGDPADDTDYADGIIHWSVTMTFENPNGVEYAEARPATFGEFGDYAWEADCSTMTVTVVQGPGTASSGCGNLAFTWYGTGLDSTSVLVMTIDVPILTPGHLFDYADETCVGTGHQYGMSVLGSSGINQMVSATYADCLDPTPTATATSTPTQTPTATATDIPTATATATDEPTATATDVPTATATDVPTATATATEEPTATDVPTIAPTTVVLDPTATSEVIDPTATSEVTDPTATSEVTDPTATSEVIDPTATSEVINPTATSEVIDPTATSEVIDPTATSEVIDPTATAPVITDPSATSAPTQPSDLVEPTASAATPVVTVSPSKPSDGSSTSGSTTTAGRSSSSATTSSGPVVSSLPNTGSGSGRSSVAWLALLTASIATIALLTIARRRRA